MKPVSIKIEKPCQEDWNKMTPTDRGRFCGACQKNVTDFSKMTDNEILQFLSEHTGPMCGQLREGQLNRLIVHTRLNATNWRLNSLISALVMAGAAASASAQTTTPATEYHPTVVIDEKHPTGPVCKRLPGTEKKIQHILKAQVVDSLDGNPQAHARVQIAGTNHYATTDEKGNFILEIPDSLATSTISLVIHCPGYFATRYSFALEKIGDVNKIELVLEERYFKGEMIIETPSRKCGNDVK